MPNEPLPPAVRRFSLDWWLAPKRVFLGVLVVIAVVIFVTPEPDIGDGAPALSTYGAGAYGARGLFRVAERLGWPAQRRTEWMRAKLDSNVTYAILDPPMALTGAEVHNVLDAVRRGAGLLVVTDDRTPMAESLHVKIETRFGTFGPKEDTSEDAIIVRDSATRAADSIRAHRAEVADSTFSDSTMSEVFTKAVRAEMDQSWMRSYIKPTRTLPESSVTLYSVNTRRRSWPSVLGIPIGNGRVVIVADPNMLRNGVLRRGEAGVMAVRSLEWLGPPRGRPLAFDEFHHGFGPQSGMWHVLARGLFGTQAGRTTTQILIAGLLLFVAMSVRPIPPRNRAIVERRSPLEHVGALARAYEQIGATRLATRRLIHGLRRRHPLGAAIPDDTYLAVVGDRNPSAVGAVRTVQSALDSALTPAQFAQVGEAIDTIERTLSK